MCSSISKRSGRLIATFAMAFGVIAATATGAWATGDPCLSVTLTCQDAVEVGQPIPYSGTVTNCGPIAFAYVSVENVGFGIILETPLAPGASADFSGSYVPSSYPSTDTVIARGYVNGPSDPSYSLAIANATCGVAPPTEICRTPGFWGTHAGIEKAGSQDITLAVIQEVGSLSICGKVIDRTTILSSKSAVEAMCVSPQGAQRLQLARQLTAAALNCVMSNGNANCEDSSIGDTFVSCNDICAGLGDQTQLSSCKSELDCYNNGGVLLGNGMCKIGTCAGVGVTPCDSDKVCGVNSAGLPIACVPTVGNCHDRNLVNADLGLDFTDPGPAGSSTACNNAIKNTCTIFGCGGR